MALAKAESGSEWRTNAACAEDCNGVTCTGEVLLLSNQISSQII